MTTSADSSRYSCVAIALHWTIAILMIGVWCAGLWMTEAKEVEATKDLAYQTYAIHKATGIIVLLLSCFRLYWRLTHTPPALPDTLTAMQKRLASGAHWLLYFFMFAFPLSGWVMSSAGKHAITIYGWFEWPMLPIAELENAKAIGGFAHEMHELMPWMLAAVVAGHAGAALYHHVILKDNVLTRMLPECGHCKKLKS